MMNWGYGRIFHKQICWGIKEASDVWCGFSDVWWGFSSYLPVLFATNFCLENLFATINNCSLNGTIIYLFELRDKDLKVLGSKQDEGINIYLTINICH